MSKDLPLGKTTALHAGQSLASSILSAPLKRKSKEGSTNFSKAFLSRSQNLGNVSKKRKIPISYEPIKLPEDILTIQAQGGSTPVTELPYLLIAAHLGSLPSSQTIRHPNSESESPLTVFRDMFVMAVDVSAYETESIHVATNGRLITIECIQLARPQLVFTQTGIVGDKGEYIIDEKPNLDTMPSHSSFNYAQHRIQLPEQFSEEGLKVGYDDVSRYVIITGRLVHKQPKDFPESWNLNKNAQNIKKPLVNTLWEGPPILDEVRKLALKSPKPAQSSFSDGIPSVSPILAYGRRSWLEREGAKLRAIQRQALRDNVRKVKELQNRRSSLPTGLENNPAPTTPVPTKTEHHSPGKQNNKTDFSQNGSTSPHPRGNVNPIPSSSQQPQSHLNAPALLSETGGVGGQKAQDKYNNKSNYNHPQGSNPKTPSAMSKQNGKSAEWNPPPKIKSKEDNLGRTKSKRNNTTSSINNNKQKVAMLPLVNSRKNNKVTNPEKVPILDNSLSNLIRINANPTPNSAPPTAISPPNLPVMSEHTLQSQRAALSPVNPALIIKDTNLAKNKNDQHIKTPHSISEPIILAALKELSKEEEKPDAPALTYSEPKKTKTRKQREERRNTVSCQELSLIGQLEPTREHGEKNGTKPKPEQAEPEDELDLESQKELWQNLLYLAGMSK